MITIELDGDQIDKVVREELAGLLETLAECGEDAPSLEHIAAVLSYYSVPTEKTT